MQFGIFYEHQLPKPWSEDDEFRLLRDALDQVELADRLGFDYAWEVEHHFLDEYSHCSNPEVLYGAIAAKTERIRLGTAVTVLLLTTDTLVGAEWPRESIEQLAGTIDSAGLHLAVVESIPVHEDIKLGRSSRDRCAKGPSRA